MTPSFKELLRQDVGRVFLNPAEFGEHHEVNGKPMTILLDDMENIEREKKQSSHADGIHARRVLFYVAAEEFGTFPIEGGMILLDGERYTVVEATDERGVYAITMEANQSHAKGGHRWT